MRSISFARKSLSAWSRETVEALKTCDILKPSGYAESVRCDECERGCFSDVDLICDDDGRPQRAYVYCSERNDIARVEIPLSDLQCWTINADALVMLLCDQTGCTAAEMLVNGRLWWFGRPGTDASRRDYFFVVGANRSDSAALYQGCGRLNECRSAMLFSPWSAPAMVDGHIKVVTLSRLLRIEDGAVRLDTKEIDALWAEPPTGSASDEIFAVEQKCRIVYYYGEPFKLTPTQAKVVFILHEAWLRDKPEVTMKTIQCRVEEAPGKMSTIFKGKDRRSRIIKQVGIDIYRLAAPCPKEQRK